MGNLREVLRGRFHQAEWIKNTMEKLMEDPDGRSCTNAEIAGYMLSWMGDVNELYEAVSKAIELWDDAGDWEMGHMREQMQGMVEDAKKLIEHTKCESEYPPTFETMKYSLLEGLKVFIANHPGPVLEAFQKDIEGYLDSFIGGESDKEFSFSISRRESNDMEYIDFNCESGCIEVVYGGHTYDPAVGGDSYTNWQYTVWRDGSYDGNLTDGEFYTVFWMLAEAGDSKLTIESPDEFAYPVDEDGD